MFRDRKPSRGPAGRGREAYRPLGLKPRGAGGIGPWPTKGRRFVDAPYNINKKNKLKEQKQVQTAVNPRAVAEDFVGYRQRMLITLDPDRKLEEKEIAQIKEALLDALEPLEDGYFPQFYGTSVAKGALVMSCANEQTKLWLERIVPDLKPWKGAKLLVKPKGEVAQGTKVLLKTPKLFAKTEPKKILQMLGTQNKTLDTSLWKNVSVTSEATGQTLVFMVDDQSVEAIRALDNKVYLGLGNVDLVIVNEEDGKQTSADTDEKNEEESDKQTSGDTDMKNKEGDAMQMSVDADMKNEEEVAKQTPSDTDMKNQEEAAKQTSVDTDMKNQEEADKETCVDTDMKNKAEADKQTT
ncbi:uncharacterized protein LOC126425032 [Schistocerca serialis cubense]|uniref:uncharacterized protein LOC126425032 n=1 Tax=Schistocerca serialis cubense TaxID=2023355 RepID=UPI00214F40A6|nr:uncharacterized protein LOC126425032 [Schistocerca serialis cubense]